MKLLILVTFIPMSLLIGMLGLYWLWGKYYRWYNGQK